METRTFKRLAVFSKNGDQCYSLPAFRSPECLKTAEAVEILQLENFIGNPDRCPSACEAQTTGPNGNAGADCMASIIAHELEEAVTDPNLNAWYQGRYSENADKCAWTFGTVYTTSNGAKANMKLGNRDFLIQQNWVNALGGYCALSY